MYFSNLYRLSSSLEYSAYVFSIGLEILKVSVLNLSDILVFEASHLITYSSPSSFKVTFAPLFFIVFKNFFAVFAASVANLLYPI